MVAWIGKIRDRELAGLAGRWLERAARLGPVELRELRASRAHEPARRQDEDFASLRAAVRGGETVLLSERGQGLTSRELAAYLGERLVRSGEPTWLLAGGEEGFRPEQEAWAGRRLKLSDLTLAHDLARAVLAEQVYRAMTILRHVKYHR